MYKGAVVAAVVPAYKEERHIARVVETMPAIVDHIVIVDDCSPDGTSAAVEAVADPRVTLIRHEVNQGVGGAIITESIFNFNGLGKLAISANTNYDLPVLIGIVLIAGAFVIAANIIVDILYAFIDPRVRVG